MKPDMFMGHWLLEMLTAGVGGSMLSIGSAEILSEPYLQENVGTVICGGIEEQYYQFVTWKKIKVIDGVAGPHDSILRLAVSNTLFNQVPY